MRAHLLPLLLLPLLLLPLACSGSDDVDLAPAEPAPEAAPAEATGPTPRDGSDLPVPPAPEGGRGDVYLVVYDTLRADHLGAYGHARPTSPRLDALAAEGLRFDRAYAQSAWTLASFTSLLTGQYPHQHRVVRDSKNPQRFGCLGPEQVTVAELMTHAGYRTAAFANNTFLAPEFGLQQGFDTYDFEGSTNDRIRTAEETVQRTLEWIDATPSGGEAAGPAFAMLHFMEPHLDYDPPEAIAGTFADPAARPEQLSMDGGTNPWSLMQMGRLTPDDDAKDYAQRLYDEEILAADAALGAFVDGLKDRGRYDSATIVITADHGEEFWEHDGFEHGHALWAEVTRVPLIIKAPRLAPGVVPTVVEHVDLVKGLLTRVGAPVAPSVQGDDLFAVAAAPPANRTSLQENCLYGKPCISVVDQTHRLLFSPLDGSGQVWAVDERGMERTRLQGEEQQAVGKALVDRLGARRGGLAPIQAAAGPKVPSYETFSQLAALGYVDADQAPAPNDDTPWKGCTGG